MSGAARSRSVSLSFKMSIIMSRYVMLVLLEVGMAIDRKGERAEGGTRRLRSFNSNPRPLVETRARSRVTDHFVLRGTERENERERR